MKLKEIPYSIYHTVRLISLSSKNLKKEKTEKQIPVIISLTSIPSRLHKVHITIRSILDQSKQPKKIILWLNENDKNVLPESLTNLTGNIFEIQFTPLTCSHKKLIHTLELYPNDIITTCDDDFIYDKNWIEGLYNEHLKNPNCVIANQVRQIKFDDQNNLLDYKKWNYTEPENLKSNLGIGAGGILYPPKSLDPQVTNINLALELAPKADDLWFKAMSLLQNTNVLPSQNPPKRLIPIFGTQKVSLKKENIDKNKNVTQLKALIDYFNLKFN